MGPCSNSVRAVGTHNTFSQREGFVHGGESPGWCTEGWSIHDKPESTAEPNHPLPQHFRWKCSRRGHRKTPSVEVAREQDRAPVPKTPEALAWVSHPSSGQEQAGLRLPSPWGGWEGTEVKTTKGAMTWEKWQEVLCEGWGAVKRWIISSAFLVNRGDDATARWDYLHRGGMNFLSPLHSLLPLLSQKYLLALRMGHWRGSRGGSWKKWRVQKGVPSPLCCCVCSGGAGWGEGGQDR